MTILERRWVLELEETGRYGGPEKKSHPHHSYLKHSGDKTYTTNIDDACQFMSVEAANRNAQMQYEHSGGSKSTWTWFYHPRAIVPIVPSPQWKLER